MFHPVGSYAVFHTEIKCQPSTPKKTATEQKTLEVIYVKNLRNYSTPPKLETIHEDKEILHNIAIENRIRKLFSFITRCISDQGNLSDAPINKIC